MKHSIAYLAGAAIIVATLASPAFAQGTPQTVGLTTVDPASLATGYRTSKVVGKYRLQRGQRGGRDG